MKRPDLDNVNKAVEKKLIDRVSAKGWMALPYIDIGSPDPTKQEDGFAKYMAEQIAEKIDQLDLLRSFESDHFYFDQFICRYATQTIAVGIEEDGRAFRLFILPDNLKPYPFGFIRMGLRIKPTPDEPRNIETNWSQEMDRFFATQPELKQAIINNCYFVLGRLAAFRDYNNQKDLYMVAEREAKPPKVKGVPTFKEQLRQVQGPRIIYLDALPSAGGSTEDALTGREQRPHQRRGTWVTLRAERFRYHPKFQVEKGVYRKPTWVGDREAIVNGNLYTILD